MKLMHYKKRDRIIDNLRLWGLVLLQAKLRKKLYPYNPKANKWLEKARYKYYNQNTTRSLLGEDIKEIGMIASILNSDRVDYINLSNFLNNRDHHISQNILNLINISTIYGEKQAEITKLYIRMKCNFELDKNKAAIFRDYVALTDISQEYKSKQDPVFQNVESSLFYEVKKNGINLYIPEKTSKKNKIAIFSYSLEGLEDYVYCLPKNSDICCFILNGNLDLPKEKYFDDIGTSLEYKMMPDDISPYDSPLDLKSASRSEAVAAQIVDLIEASIPKTLRPEIMTTPLKEALKLGFDDLLYSNLKNLFTFAEILSEYNMACFVYHTLNTPIDHYFNIALSNFGKNRIFFAINGNNKARNMIISERSSASWFDNNIRPLVTDNFPHNPDTILTNEEFISDYKASMSSDNIPNIKFAGKENVIIFCHPKDPNYRKMALALCKKLAGKYHITFQMFISGSKEGKSLKSKLRSISKDNAFNHRIKVLPAEVDEIRKSGKLSYKSEWQNHVKDKVSQSILTSKYIQYKDYDLGFGIYRIIPDFINIYLESFILYEIALRREFKKKKPKFLIMCPARLPSSFMMMEIARENNVPVIDLQAVFQSNHPRYKTSKGDVFAMIDDYQRKVYLETHKLRKNQKIELVGSQNVNEAREKLVNFDQENIRHKLKIPDNHKIVTFATQPGYLNHNVLILESIIEGLNKIPDTYLLIKLHPREMALYKNVYERTLRVNNFNNHSSLIQKFDIDEIISVSDILITMYSTVGFTAAACGKNVISVNLTGENMPNILGEMGLCLSATSDKQLRSIITELLSEGKALKTLTDQREKFFNSNPYYRDGKTLDKVIDIAEKLVAANTNES